MKRILSARRSRLLLTAASTLLALGLLEGALRLAPVFMGEPARSFLVEAAQFRLSNLRSYPGDIPIRIPPPQQADILVVGDSVPFGMMVRQADIYPTLLGVALRQNVVNLASASQMPPAYNRMVEVGSQYRPGIVLYALFANDFVYAEDVEPMPLDRSRADDRLEGDDRLFFTRYGVSGMFLNTLRRVTNYSVSYALFKISRQRQSVPETVEWWQSPTTFFLLTERSYWDALVGWQDERVRRGTALTLRFIQEAHRFSTADLAADFIVVLSPSKEMVYGPLTGPLRSRVYSESWDRTFDQVARRLSEAGIRVLDLRAALRLKAREGAKLYQSIDGHFNVEGHQLVAQVLQRELVRRYTH